MRLMPGALETLSELKQRGLKLAVISGSLQIVLDKLLPDYHFDHVLISRMLFDDQGQLIGGVPTEFDMAGKGAGLAAIAARESIPLESCVFVGDNFNDISAMRVAGLGIAFNCKSEELAQVADVVVEGKDLRGILQHVR
jgi:phosphoserine phosphatase